MKCVIPACYRGVRLHIWSGNHNAVPGRTGRTPMPETSNQLPPATCVCAGSDDDGLGDRQAPGGVDTPDDSQAGVRSSSQKTPRMIRRQASDRVPREPTNVGELRHHLPVDLPLPPAPPSVVAVPTPRAPTTPQNFRDR